VVEGFAGRDEVIACDLAAAHPFGQLKQELKKSTDWRR
jgi:hypothetical protein